MMTLLPGFQRFGLVLLAALLMAEAPAARQAYAQADDAERLDYSGIIQGFSLGFADSYTYDYCGDTDIGERYRKFYRRLLETCDLSPYQRSVIRQNFEWATEVIPSTIAAPRRLRALQIDPNSDEAAPRLFGGRYRCDEAYYRDNKPEAEAELDEVEQGQPAPDTMMPGPCKK